MPLSGAFSRSSTVGVVTRAALCLLATQAETNLAADPAKGVYSTRFSRCRAACAGHPSHDVAAWRRFGGMRAHCCPRGAAFPRVRVYPQILTAQWTKEVSRLSCPKRVPRNPPGWFFTVSRVACREAISAHHNTSRGSEIAVVPHRYAYPLHRVLNQCGNELCMPLHPMGHHKLLERQRAGWHVAPPTAGQRSDFESTRRTSNTTYCT